MKNYIRAEDNDFMQDFPKSIRQLWIDLYEHGFVEIEDVKLITLWIKALSQVGYKFPNSESETGTTTRMSGEHKRLFAGGKTLYEFSRKYLDKLYRGNHYLNSTCLFNIAGNHKIKLYIVLSLKPKSLCLWLFQVSLLILQRP
jgi:hypothetical protein